MSARTKLELTWIGKDKVPRLEPRILLEDPAQSHHATSRVTDNDIFDNRLIHGDNLLALRALEQEFAGAIKCIFIDPPYNTGQAFEHYDDGIEGSLWLSLMHARLAILQRLLHPEGVIFVQIDDRNLAHMRLLLDEVFGPKYYINTVAVKTKQSSGASGGGEDRRLKKNIEFLLAYSGPAFIAFNDVYNQIPIETYLEMMRLEEKSFKYTSIFTNPGQKTFIQTIKDGSGNDMQLYRVTGYETKSVLRVAREEHLSEVEVLQKYYDIVHTTENAQTSIRTRVQEATGTDDAMYALDYVPGSGRNRGKHTELLFMGPQKRLVGWFRNVTSRSQGRIFKRERLGTLWNDLNWNNVTREGGVRFPNGQKPEKLVSTCVELATQEGDIVLDSFLGSGTTAAVSHKMKRRWIGIELGDHCATHCIPRLKSVINGTDTSGVSSDYNWKGGGGFRYFKLAPSLLQKDRWDNWVISSQYNAAMLAEAMCKHEGFRYQPSTEHYWQQGLSTERDFIYVTTQTLTKEQLAQLSAEVGPGHTLLICCGAFRADGADFPNLTIKKIPNAVLERCEWGKDDYSLSVAELTPQPDPEPISRTNAGAIKPKRKKEVSAQTLPLFGAE